MAITVNLKPRSFSPRCTSRDPDGIAVAPDAPITIIGTVAQGNEVILRTASLNFGGVAPEFVRRVLLQPANAGSDYVPQAGVNYQQGRLVKNGFYYQSSDPTKRIPVHAVAGMPNGVAFAVGDKGTDPALIAGNPDTTAPINVETSKYYTQKFEHYYVRFPEANQNNIRTALQGGQNFNLFNIKPNWIGREGGDFGDDNVNFYSRPFDASASTAVNIFKDPTLRISNVSSLATKFLPSPLNLASEPSGNIPDYPMCLQTGSRIDANNGFDWIKYVVDRSDVNPVLCDQTVSNTDYCRYPMTYPVVELRGLPFTNEFNQQRLFGFVRGFGINWGFNYYSSDHFLQFGDGAFSRVEIVDISPTYGNESRISVMTPLYWSLSGKELAFKVEAGIFHGESLSGKTLRVYNHLNQLVGERLIP